MSLSNDGQTAFPITEDTCGGEFSGLTKRDYFAAAALTGMNYEEREQAYMDHADNCDERGHHVDGCFYCGGDHPSDCCRDDERDGYW